MYGILIESYNDGVKTLKISAVVDKNSRRCSESFRTHLRKDTVKQFCEWLLTKEHQDCIVVAHNFQGYDGYFITKYLIKNAIKYEFILRGAKILSMTIPMFNIKFIDSLNFIPMSLAKFPKTFGQDELCKGHFPHLFNKFI